MSGLESRRLLDTFRDFKVKHIQLSYYYLRRVFNTPQELAEYLGGFTTVLIDSGTHYNNIKSEEEKASFLGEYYSFMQGLDRRAYTACVAERGLKLEDIIPEEALIYPYEDVREVFNDDLPQMCKHLTYIGVSANKMKSQKDSTLDRLFQAARKEGTLIHAFATSSRRILGVAPYYSANSSSWRSGSRYLNTYIYEGAGRSLRIYQPTDKGDKVKTEKELERIRTRQEHLIRNRQPELHSQIDFSQVLAGESWEVDKANLTQWILYQEEMGLQPQGKYYLEDNDRQDIIFRKRALLSKVQKREETPKPVEKEVDMALTEEEVKEYTTGVYKGGQDIEGEVVEGAEYKGVEEVVDAEVVESSPSTSTELSTYVPASVGTPPATQKKVRITPVDARSTTLRQCDYCILADRCPKYAPASECSYGLPPVIHTEDLDTVKKEHQADMMAIMYDRIQMAAMQERLDGTGLNKDLTNALKLYAEFQKAMAESSGEMLEVKARGPGVMDMFKPRK